MAKYNKFDQFVEDQSNAVHNLGTDQLSVFLTNVAPVKGNAVLADITEIDYTNLSAHALTTTSSMQTDGTYRLLIEDLVLTASDVVPDFRWVGVYNDTPTSPADPLICWADQGGTVQLIAAQTYSITFDQTNGLFSET